MSLPAPKLEGGPYIMGIVNVTPDSFSDGGRYGDPAKAAAHALALIEAGADIVDIGGESTRPGAAPVSQADEIARVVPVIAEIRARTDTPISIDTMKPAVARAAFRAGAGLWNDVGALSAGDAIETAAALTGEIILMHMQGEPRTMQAAPHYADVVGEVRAFLAGRIAACRAAGIDAARIVVDPGFGFGKTVAHNLTLLGNLAALTDLGVPVLTGLSRKSTLGKVTGRAPEERLAASVAAALMAVERGARIVRVHDVAPTRDAIAIWSAVRTAPGVPPPVSPDP